MPGKRRTTEEISHMLAQAEAGVPVKELCRKYGVAEATFYAWRMEVRRTGSERAQAPEAARGGEPQAQARLVADLALDKQILQDAVAGKF